MLVMFSRSIVLYIIILVVLRTMGKREVGQLQPYELGITIMIADLIAIPMTNIGIPIINGIIPVLALLIMYLFISIINLKSVKARGIICGKPSILIYRGKIQEDILKKEKFTVNELQEKLRISNISSLGDVEYAILETGGQVTVIPKPEKRGIRPEDFQIVPEYEGLPYDLVIDGRIINDNLTKIGRDKFWLKKELAKFKLNSKNTLIATIDGKGQIFCQGKKLE
jgi:Predicted membrane protein